jgi:diguanylate cyclase (GGDEF)-like protein/PAS domain S-box-containing protein
MAPRARLRRGVIAAAVVLAAFVVCTRGSLVGETTTTAVSDLGLTLAALAAGLLCVRAGRQPGVRRLSWLLLGAGCAAFAFGEGTWAFYELVLGREVGTPSIADVGYLGAIPLVVAGLLLAPGWAGAGVSRARALVDGALMASSLLLVSWVAVLGPTWYAEGSLWSSIVQLIYPAGDIVIVAVGVTIAVRARAGGRLWLVLLCAGAGALAIADSGFAAMAVRDSYASGSWFDAGWLAGYLLIALAACAAAPVPAPPLEGPVRAARAAMLAPYVPLAVASGTVLVRVFNGRSFDQFEMVAAIVIVVLAFVRQALTFMDTASLSRDLADTMDELRAREDHFRSLVQGSADTITVCDEHGVLLYASPALTRDFGFDVESMPGRSLIELVHPEDVEQVRTAFRELRADPAETALVECRLRGVDGEYRYVETVMRNQLSNPSVRGIVLNGRDVTERRALEREITYQAFHDPLTGLANRSLFRDRVQHAVERRSRDHAPLAVLVLDLDGFKSVNDSLGHLAGDEVLQITARRLLDCVRPGETVARLGGDEFALLLEDLDEIGAIATCRQVADRVQEALAWPSEVMGREVVMAASVGIALLAPGDGADELLRNADLAMYRAKAAGRARCELFEPGMHIAVLERLELESELRGALERKEFRLLYQPIISLESGELVGVEALLRWIHPERGMVSPLDFIPLAEDSGLIVPIGRWVLQEACRQSALWARATGRRIRMSVNLSARQVQAPRLAETVALALREHRIRPDHLVLEITESVLVDDADRTIAKLHLLRELGVKLAIDDFGTGYSSLSYLRRLPVDTLKIDRSFVGGIGEVGDLTALTGAIVALGRDLGLQTVAEGIEDATQLAELRGMGCELGQGFMFARPLPADEIAELLGSGSSLIPVNA